MEKMRRRRRISGIALFILLMLAAMAGAFASEDGMVNDTVMWQLDDSGVITITGSGAIPDYSRGDAPWNKYKGRITEVLFYGNITRIGNYAFADCTKITHIAFPGTLKTIGKGAFIGCTSLAASDTVAQSWSLPSYEWARDYSTLTATRVSNLDASVVQTETVNSRREVITETTCLQDGSEKYTAGGFKNSAFKEQTITVTVPAPGHTPVTDEGEAPTCTEPGKTAGSHCGVCGAVIAAAEIIPASGHTLSYVDDEESTCAKPGCTAHWHCSVCEKDFADEEGQTETDPALPLADHSLTGHDAKEPTCTEAGNIAWWECSVCSKCFSDENGEHEIAPEGTELAPAHKLKVSERTEPGCFTNGREAFWMCEVCHLLFSDAEGKDQITEPVWLDPVGEHALEHRPVKQATCTEPGRDTEYWYCTRCQKYFADEQASDESEIKEPEAIAALADTDPLGHEWEAPEYTWSKDGSACTAKRTCIRNPEHAETEQGKITARTTPATTEAAGKTVYTATFTNEAFATQTNEVIIPKLEQAKPPAGAYTDKATGTYDIREDGTATFKKPAKAKATVKVPDTVTVNGLEVPVTAIADKAFSKNSKLTTVTIGNNVKTIGKNAFNGCAKLKTVKGGKTVETIRDGAFSGCEKLTALPAFGKLKAIGANAFKGCKALTKVTIGANVNAIGKNAFNGCAKLKTITIKSTLLTKKNVKSGAFKGIHEKATVKCPKKQLKEYKKFLPGKGVPKTATIK